MRNDIIKIYVKHNLDELLSVIDHLNALDLTSYDIEYNVQKNCVTTYSDETEEILNSQALFISDFYQTNFSIFSDVQKDPSATYRTQKDLVLFLKKYYES